MFAGTLGIGKALSLRPRRHICAWLTILCALIGMVAAAARAGTISGYLTFNVALPEDSAGLGHAWAVVRPTEGPQDNLNLAYGLYPVQKNLFDRDTAPPGARGMIFNDISLEWDYQITFPLNSMQLFAAQQYIETRRANQQAGTLGWDALAANGTDFVRGLATAASVTLPNAVNGFGVSDPATLGNDLRQIGDGNTYSGGTVSTSATLSANPPVPADFSHAAILSRALLDPAGLAAQIGIPVEQTSAAPRSTRTTFDISLQGISPSSAIMAIDWGDSNISHLTQSFVLHSYTSPGTYLGRIVVLENGGVHATDFTVNVSPDASAALLPVNITPLTDPHPANPGANSVPFLLPPSHWLHNGTGNWFDAANWTIGVPGGVGAWAQFDDDYGVNAPAQVQVNSPVTLGGIRFFSGTAPYTIAGSNTITLAVSSGRATLKVDAGTHTISAPLVVDNDLDVIVSDSFNGKLTIQGSMTATGRTLYKDGVGELVLPVLTAAGLNVTAGDVHFTTKAIANDPSGTSVIQNLSIATAGVVDVANNSMIINYSGVIGTLLTTVRQHLQTGRLTGRNSGTFGLGYGDNAVLGLGTFSGVSVGTNSILIKSTYDGDANLDGRVDIIDLRRLAQGFKANGTWTSGDFNYDGFVDSGDLGLLARSWQAGVGAPLSADLASLGGVDVPEPAPAGAGLVAAFFLFQRRRTMATTRNEASQ